MLKQTYYDKWDGEKNLQKSKEVSSKIQKISQLTRFGSKFNTHVHFLGNITLCKGKALVRNILQQAVNVIKYEMAIPYSAMRNILENNCILFHFCL